MKKLTKEKLKYLSDLEKSATPADWIPIDLGQALKSSKDIKFFRRKDQKLVNQK